MPLVVKCDYCRQECSDYYKIYQFEDHSQIAVEPDYMCYSCALVSRKLRFV